MRRARAWLSDLSLADRVAAGLGLVLVPVFVLSPDEPPEGIAARSFDAGAVLLLVAAGLALLARRRFPGTTVLVMTALACTWYTSGYANGAINIPTLIAFYNLGTTGDRRRQFGVGALALSVPVVVILAQSDVPPREALDALGYPLAALLFGELVRSRRLLLLAEYAAKAETAERDAEAEADRRVTEERLRIAQDVHDVLAHAVSVMTVQAAAGADTLDRDPEAARKALADIRAAGKGAMAELRTTVAVLRGGGPGAAAAAAPAPRLDRLAELVDGARAQGLDVELILDLVDDGDSDGDSSGLDGLDGVESLVQLAAYRVVQESLTNVIRHAGAARAVVRLERCPSELVVTVTDDGRGPGGPEPSGGGAERGRACFGLRGMRERVESLGGSLHCGRRPDARGWQVVATLPVGTRVRSSR